MIPVLRGLTLLKRRRKSAQQAIPQELKALSWVAQKLGQCRENSGLDNQDSLQRETRIPTKSTGFKAVILKCFIVSGSLYNSEKLLRTPKSVCLCGL